MRSGITETRRKRRAAKRRAWPSLSPPSPRKLTRLSAGCACPASSGRHRVHGPIEGAVLRDERGRLIARVEEVRTHETGNDRRLGGGHPAARAPLEHELIGQPIEDMKWRSPTIGEAGQIDSARTRVHERRTKPGTAVAAADATRPAVAAVLDGQL